MRAETETPEIVTETRSLVPAQGNCPAFPTNALCACTSTFLAGSCAIFTHDVRFYMNLSLPPYSGFNDSIDSLVVGPDAKVKLAEHPGGASVYHIVFGSGANGYRIDSLYQLAQSGLWQENLSNVISAIRVDNSSDNQCQSPAPGQVAIFGNLTYNNNGTDQGDCVILDPGSYPNHNTNPPAGATPSYSGGGFGLDNDSITSIKTHAAPSSATIDLYPEPSNGGVPLIRNSSDPDLRTSGYNDRTSAIVVTSP
jgi:hypothetical protein